MPSSAAMSMTFKPGNDSGDSFPDSVPDLRTDELGKFRPNDDNGLEDTGFRRQRIDNSQVLPGLFFS